MVTSQNTPLRSPFNRIKELKGAKDFQVSFKGPIIHPRKSLTHGLMSIISLRYGLSGLKEKGEPLVV